MQHYYEYGLAILRLGNCINIRSHLKIFTHIHRNCNILYLKKWKSEHTTFFNSGVKKQKILVTPKTHIPQYLTLCSITSDMPSIHRNNFMHLQKGLFSHFYPSLLQRSWHIKAVCSLPWFFIFPIHYSCQHCIASIIHLSQDPLATFHSVQHSSCYCLWPWRSRQHVPPKHCYPPSELHSITIQKTTFWITLNGKIKVYLFHDCIHSLTNGVSKNEHSVLMD